MLKDLQRFHNTITFRHIVSASIFKTWKLSIILNLTVSLALI